MPRRSSSSIHGQAGRNVGHRSDRTMRGPARNPLRRPSTAAQRHKHRGGEANPQGPFVPPEDWYEVEEEPAGADFFVVTQDPGHGFRHVVDESDVRKRLSELPDAMLEGLHVVQLSRMTRKKRTFPCYGMQWGSSLYLYPIEESMVEYFSRPPHPKELNETRMFGGKWSQEGSVWQLTWSEEAIRDYYLNNVLIHELGHLLDDRNTGYIDRERYAEWFAIEHGYRKTAAKRKQRKVKRRHHH